MDKGLLITAQLSPVFENRSKFRFSSSLCKRLLACGSLLFIVTLTTAALGSLFSNLESSESLSESVAVARAEDEQSLHRIHNALIAELRISDWRNITIARGGEGFRYLSEDGLQLQPVDIRYHSGVILRDGRPWVVGLKSFEAELQGRYLVLKSVIVNADGDDRQVVSKAWL